MASDLEREVRELRRRFELMETRVSQLEGSFGFISNQLRDVQLYMHNKFAAIDERFDKIEADTGLIKRSLLKLTATVEAMPRVLVEMLDERNKRRSEPDND